MTEAELQAAVVELATLLGWRHMHVRRSIGKGRKWVTSTNVPWPDLTLWHPGRGYPMMVRELKVNARSVWQPGQRELLLELESCGIDADVWTVADLDSGRIQRELTPWRADDR
jgi:hypothetical protein